MHHGNIAVLGLLQREICQNFVGRQDPIHRHRMAALRRTTQPQRPVSTGPASDLNLPAGENRASDQTVAFLIQKSATAEIDRAFAALRAYLHQIS
jgi:hypothetical protein